jgi:hypothetical protein
MKFHWQSLLALYLLSCLALAGQEKPAHGDVMDAGSLRKVHTFCLDKSLLFTPQLKEFSMFSAHAQKPKGVFSKLNWHLMDYCGDADATVLITMEETERPRNKVGNVIDPYNILPKADRVQRAKLLITSGTSGKTLYQGDGGEFIDDRQDAFGSAFSELLKELKSLSK